MVVKQPLFATIRFLNPEMFDIKFINCTLGGLHNEYSNYQCDIDFGLTDVVAV